MTTQKILRSTFEDLDQLFENSTHLSIRYYNRVGDEKWDVIIRHSNNPDIVRMVNRAKTSRELAEVECLIARECGTEANPDIEGLL